MQWRGERKSGISVLTAAILVLVLTLSLASTARGVATTAFFDAGLSTIPTELHFLELRASPLNLVAEQSKKYWYVGAASFQAMPNHGVRGSIEVKAQPEVSAFLSFWVSDTLSNDLWAQVGYYIFHSQGPMAFYQVWNLSTLTEIGSGEYTVSNGVYLFSMLASNGTRWSFYVDSRMIGTFDTLTYQSMPSSEVYALSEEGYCHSPFPFEQVDFRNGMQVQNIYGAWVNVSRATSYGSAWGIVRSNQDSSLGVHNFLVGGS